MPKELTDYGSLDFIVKVLGLMYQKHEFLRAVLPVMKPEYFDHIVDQTFAGIFLDFGRKYPGSALSRTVVHSELRELVKAKKLDERELPLYMGRFADIHKKVPEPEYIEEKVFQFIERRAMELALADSIHLLKKGEFDKIAEAVGKARAIRKEETDKFERFVLMADPEEYVKRLKDPEKTEKMKGTTTGIVRLDEHLLAGGIRPQEMFIDLAPTGRGKTNALLNKALAASLSGDNLLYYTLEVGRVDYENRCAACLTGYSVKRLRFEADRVYKRLKRVEECFPKKGKIILSDLPSKYLKPSTIVRDLTRYRGEGIDIKGVVVDYADIMMSDKKYRTEDKRLELGNIYLELRGIAKEFNVYVYSASQGNRSSLSKIEISMSEISEDFSKAFSADYVVSLSQTPREKAARSSDGTGTGIMRLYIAKNRNDISGVNVEIMTDFSCCRLSKYDWDNFDKEVYHGI